MNELIKHGKVTTTNCSWGMNELCKSSQPRAVMNQMNDMYIPIDTNTLNSLIPIHLSQKKTKKHYAKSTKTHTQCLPENNAINQKEERKRMMEAINQSKTRQEGGPIVKSMKKLLQNTNKRIRDKKLMRKQNKQTALHFLYRKMSVGKVQGIDCTWSMEHLCESSLEARDLMKEMVKNRVKIDEMILNGLMLILLKENDKEVVNLMEIEFKRYGISSSILPQRGKWTQVQSCELMKGDTFGSTK